MCVPLTGRSRLNAHLNRRTKLAASPTCNSGLENQTAEYILQIPTSADRTTKCVSNSSPATRETMAAGRSYGHNHLADQKWSVTLIEKNKLSFSWCLQEWVEPGLNPVTQLSKPPGADCSSLVWSWVRMTSVFIASLRMGCCSCRCCSFWSSICCLMVLAGSWSWWRQDHTG